MRSAPPVDHPVGRCAVWAWCGASLGLVVIILATDRLSAWARHADLASDRWTAWLAGLTLVWCVAAWRSWQRQPEGLLRWQPDPGDPAVSGWRWCQGPGSEPCHVTGVLDLGSLWLVRVVGNTSNGVPRWIWLTSRAAPEGWSAVRRAVWASRGNPDAVDRSVIFPRA